MPNLNQTNLATPVSVEMTKAIEKLVTQDVLEPVSLSPSFTSRMFLVPKSDGSARPIFNLRALNDYVLTTPFKLLNMYQVPDFLQPQDWLCKVDLSQAYFHQLISKSHRRYLRLIYKGQLMEMTCLPFGLSTAPKTFACLTNWIAQSLRDQGVRIIVYLDDYLLAHQDKDTLVKHVNLLTNRLNHLGFLVNVQKSQLIPQKNLSFLGVHWDPWKNQKYLPQDKVSALRGRISEILKTNRIDSRALRSLIEVVNFASFAVPRGRLNYRDLLVFLNSLPEEPSTKLYYLPGEVRVNLIWWYQNCHRVSQIHVPPPTHFLTTDASDQAWAGQLDHIPISGPWTLTEAYLHCNCKEMLAVLKVLQEHGPRLQHSSVLLQCDSKTVVSYIRNEEGTRSLPLLSYTNQIFQILDFNQINLTAYHLPGKYNAHADHLSRHRRPPEWHLLPQCTEMLFKKLGMPLVDLFASKTAHVLENYVSLDLNDHRALFHNAFSRTWHFSRAWIFPPPFLIPRVLAHLNQATGVYLIVCPRWERVFWRADLKARALAAPFTIHNLHRHLVDTSTGVAPREVHNMTLEGWTCGGGLKAL
ncbi:unnamed protein product [Plutella xylostella]|uniref:(diamondback moth) hypothetical protein n=1 Tax=Plutella xylostella TaxID=51655 RepID=A0A8S4FWH3_PLUXY|nr:unnamed protein product [Plutella xylostella]